MKEVIKICCKIVLVVYVGVVRDFGMEVVCQVFLEVDKDNFMVVSYRNGKVFVVGGIIVILLEKQVQSLNNF